MPEDRIPVPKPRADLTLVFTKTSTTPEMCATARYVTRFGKVFEREECLSRGVVWYQVVQR
jgi:hypothetical protein